MISELKACCYFARKKYRPLHHRKKISGIEVDWITERDGEYQLWEIKSVRELGDFTLRGFSKSQLYRLGMALELWANHCQTPTSLWLMEVGLFDDFQILPVSF